MQGLVMLKSGIHNMLRGRKKWFSSAIFLCLLLLTVLCRCYNHPDIFLKNGIYFVDPDCYSRMTRVQMVLENPGVIIKEHRFENYPDGVISHATAPMDYLIAALSAILKPFSSNAVDLAGAIVSPLLGIALFCFLWFWAGRMQLPYRALALLLYATSPILVHGTVLGRPDHQSLQIFCLGIALAAEWSLFKQPSRAWGITAGIAWGLAMWVSFYEPLVFFALTVFLLVLFQRSRLLTRERYLEWGIVGGVLLLALLLEGWKAIPSGAWGPTFMSWKKSIGEMGSLTWFSPAIFYWVGWGLLLAPLFAVWKMKKNPALLIPLIFILTLYALTVSQIRWGYFFALVFVLFLLVALERRHWIITLLFIVSFWPVAQEWERMLYPDPEQQQLQAEQRAEKIFLRQLAGRIRSSETQPILAPWWLSPPLAYWSGQPAVAGSSHQSLPGILDTVKFYMATDPADAVEIVRQREVHWVVAYDTDRTFSTSVVFLPGQPIEQTMIYQLNTHPGSPPPFLTLEFADPYFKTFRVNHEQL